ncbi:aphrodisin-like protein [Cricetulus griseus]|uniref:Aphrodisin-like protein n=1 Tax=Cricetulus griseus TaxID=10029 RepID=A0A061HYK2_CRIGR|nr:aphrodisin-like protein [Cricetulus griseus]
MEFHSRRQMLYDRVDTVGVTSFPGVYGSSVLFSFIKHCVNSVPSKLITKFDLLQKIKAGTTMAKILLLALAVGLAHALSELEGHWVSTAIGADNVEKIANQGTMRLYARQIICHEECDKLEITFYVNLNGQCSETTVIGYKQEDGNYRTQFEGDNIFKPMVITKEFLVFISKNVDRDGLETHLLFALDTCPMTYYCS